MIKKIPSIFLVVSAVLLSACASNHAPTWSITATEKPALQAKQISTPFEGSNYVLCEHCLHYTKLSSQTLKPANQACKIKT